MTDFALVENVPISKVNPEKQLVFGWANVPDPGVPVAKSMAGSEEERIEELRSDYYAQAWDTDVFWDSYIFATFKNYVIVEAWASVATYWQVKFTKGDDGYVFDFEGAKEVALTFVNKALEEGATLVKQGRPVSKAKVDRQGDVIFIDDLEDAAYEFVLKSRLGDADHERIAGVLVESFMATEEKYRALGIPEDVIPTLNKGWFVGFKVDDEAWEGVKNGTYRMFSVFGTARAEEVDV